MSFEYEPSLREMIDFTAMIDAHKFEKNLRKAIEMAETGNDKVFRLLVQNDAFRLKSILDDSVALICIALERCSDVNRIDGVAARLAWGIFMGSGTKRSLSILTMLAAAGADVSMESTGYAEIFRKKDLKGPCVQSRVCGKGFFWAHQKPRTGNLNGDAGLGTTSVVHDSHFNTRG